MKTESVIVICTRPDSKRLPGKVFKRIAGVPAINHILNRLCGCQIPVILAVPTGCNDYDYLLHEYFNRDIVIHIFKGNPFSPLHRMYDSILAYDYEVDWVVRITHDDILIDQWTMLSLIENCKKEGGIGYGISPSIVEGAGVEVFRFDNLEYAAKNRKQDTEYISYFVKNHPFKNEITLTPRSTIKRPYRLTMDYQADALLLDLVLRKTGANASLDEVVEFLDRNPYMLDINKQPELSIYTCAYNAERFVRETIDSVLNQCLYSDLPFEYIFVDDGSTDNTPYLAARYAHHPKFNFIRNEKNEGLASSSNLAISKSRGKYLLRLDADDLLIFGSLQKLIKQMADNQLGIIYPAYKEMDENGIVRPELKKPEEFHHPGCALMDKRMISELMFKDGLRHYDGLDLYNRIIRSKFKVDYYHSDPLWIYRKHEKSLSSNMTDERKKVLGELHAQ